MPTKKKMLSFFPLHKSNNINLFLAISHFRWTKQLQIVMSLFFDNSPLQFVLQICKCNIDYQMLI